MKKVILVRHGQAEDLQLGKTDFDRRLTDVGKLEVVRVGRQLFDEKLSPKSLITSHAIRAVATAKIIALSLEFLESKIEINKGLYSGTYSDYLLSIQETDDEQDTILIVGHNPVISQTVNYLTATQHIFPTAGIVVINFDVESWKDISIRK
jgi:phosphohistidine phosphatase